MNKITQALAVGAVVTLAVACGSSTHSASPTTNAGGPSSTTTVVSVSPTTGSSSSPTTGSTGTSAPTTVGVASTSTVPECSSSSLTASLGQSNGTAGTIYYPLIFTNHGSATCVMQGYPGVSFVTGSAGQQLGAPARRETGPAPIVTLNPGQSATATLGIVEAGNYGASCEITSVVGLRVYPPNNTAAMYVPHADQGCANTADVTLNVQPVTAS